MAYKEILLDVEGRIATLTLNQPDIRNPISGYGMIGEIEDACHQIQLNDDISVLIITGAGKAFSAGGNVKEMRERNNDPNVVPIHLREWYRRGIQRIPLAIDDLDVPVIAAVNGAAIGAGCDMAMMADIRIASTFAKFGETFLNLGIIPGDGGSWYLTRQIGYQMAAYLTFTGEVIDAEMALKIGIVYKVVEPDQLMAEANALAQVIASKPPRTLRVAKRLLKQSGRMSLRDFLDVCASNQALAHRTADHKEAIEAFFEKRDAVFTGN
jgi:enoyl-CoA hydratase/carnithine racemase